jgi:signal peptidase I
MKKEEKLSSKRIWEVNLLLLSTFFPFKRKTFKNYLIEGFIISFVFGAISFFNIAIIFFSFTPYFKTYSVVCLALVFFIVYFLCNLVLRKNLKQSAFTFAWLIVGSLTILFNASYREVKGKSMYPTYQEGKFVSCYPPTLIKNNDVIIFKHDKEKDYIKRIIASPKDTILFKNGYVYRNGILLNEQYINKENLTNQWEGGFTTEGKEYVVPNNSYFVLGDNRVHSSDSREFGYINKSDIECVVAK